MARRQTSELANLCNAFMKTLAIRPASTLAAHPSLAAATTSFPAAAASSLPSLAAAWRTLSLPSSTLTHHMGVHVRLGSTLTPPFTTLTHHMGVHVRLGSTLTPPFTGKKLKPYSAFKGRFKMTGTGKIRYMRPRHVHKRYNKGRSQLNELSKTKVMNDTYARTMKRLGFVMRHF